MTDNIRLKLNTISNILERLERKIKGDLDYSESEDVHLYNYTEDLSVAKYELDQVIDLFDHFVYTLKRVID